MLKVITICGSTRFKDEILKAGKDLTLLGWAVLLPLVFAHSGDTITDEQKEMLDQLHKAKIDVSQKVYVVNPGGYIGSSTRNEIVYAMKTGKDVESLEPLDGSFVRE